MVSASFTALIAAAAGVMAVALPEEPLACVEATNNFVGWTVTDFDFHWTQEFTTPAHSISAGYVSFNVTNPALGHVAQCSAFSTVYPNFFNGDKYYSCTGSIVDSTRFSWNSQTGELVLNQAWLCDTINSNKTGVTTTQLKCRDTGVTVKPDWKIGETYSSRAYNCDVVDFSVPVPIDANA